MVLPMRTGVQKLSDTPVSKLLEQWIGEQLGRRDEAFGPRPRIGVLAVGGTLRDGGWPVYGSDAPTAHAILEAGGLPCLIPALPLLEGYDPLQILGDDHTFAPEGGSPPRTGSRIRCNWFDRTAGWRSR